MAVHDQNFEEAALPFLQPEDDDPAETEAFPIHPTHSPVKIIFIVSSMIFILAFGGALMQIPGVRIYEDILCRDYYSKLEGKHLTSSPGNKIDEKQCKGEEVQSQLNVLLSGLIVMGSIPSKWVFGFTCVTLSNVRKY